MYAACFAAGVACFAVGDAVGEARVMRMWDEHRARDKALRAALAEPLTYEQRCQIVRDAANHECVARRLT